jgi:hypothetical protein
VLPPAGSLIVGAGVEGVVSPDGVTAPPAGGVVGVVEGELSGLLLPVGGAAGVEGELSRLPPPDGVVGVEAAPAEPLPPAQREFKGERSQRIFMI